MVSHGHGPWLARLLPQLSAAADQGIACVVLTHNLPEAPVQAPPQGWGFRLVELHNTQPQGFGANHNQAFGHCATPYFCVLNPDIDLTDAQVWSALRQALQAPQAGCAYPVLRNADGSLQDSERQTITPWALVRRRLLGRPETRVDWVNAAFWLLPRPVFAQLRGFDERFYLYCEDTDFCLRLQLAGWQLRKADAHAVHDARRASLKSGRFLRWHLQSLARLWLGPVQRRYLKKFRRG